MAQYETEDLLKSTVDDSEDPEDPAETEAGPGDDVPVASYDSLTVVQAIMACKSESEEARSYRDNLNEINQATAHCRPFGETLRNGQSQEFVPKTPMALEQLAAFVKRGLVGFGNYFSVDVVPSPSLTGGPLTEGGIVKLMRHRLEDPEELPPGALDFPTLVSDGVKIGALEATAVFKVCGTFVPTRRLTVDKVPMAQAFTDPVTGEEFEGTTYRDELRMEEGPVWRAP